jgi:hypothetical protein
MKSSEKFKLCPSCDGKAPLEVVICPFCAQSFNEPTSKSKQPIASGYTPPYSADRVTPTQAETKNLKDQVVKEDAVVKEKSVFLPIALLTIGSNLLILSILLLILGHEGKVELEWSSSYWMIYALLGAPLLFLGYRIVKKEHS